MIEVIGKHIQNKIMTKAKEATLFSVIADEVVDVANKEQLSICLQFADGTGVHELFADLVEVEHITGADLADTIIQKLAAWGLEISCLRGQCYDGSSNMAGIRSGCRGLYKAKLQRPLTPTVQHISGI